MTKNNDMQLHLENVRQRAQIKSGETSCPVFLSALMLRLHTQW